MLFPCVYLYFPALCNEGQMSIMKAGYNILLTILMPLWVHQKFSLPLRQTWKLCSVKSSTQTAMASWGTLRKLVTRSRKYDWRGQKTLKLNINIKEYWKAKNGKLKEIIFIKFLSKYVSQFHLNQTRFFFIIRVLYYFPRIPIERIPCSYFVLLWLFIITFISNTRIV